MTSNLSPGNLFLVLNEGCATYLVEGEPPTGDYGEDWIVVRAKTAQDAHLVGKLYLWDGLWATDSFTRVLGRESALRAFEAAK